MSLTIYGSPRSRTMRVLWLATELDLDYTHVPWAHDDPALKQPEFVELSGTGTIPTIVDDGFALSESLAINLYLAKKHGASRPQPLYPTAPELEAAVWRWSLWAQGHLEPWIQKDQLLADLMAAIEQHAAAMIHRSLAVLERTLATRPWLIDEHFTVGDLNVAAVLSPSRANALDFSSYPHAREWLDRCYARPAAVAARNRFRP